MIDEGELDATPEHFAKIYGTILDSSIWEEPDHTVRVWIAMLAMADAHGIVRASYSGLRRRCNVSMEKLAEALETLEAPDLDSRNPENEGRRIKKIKGGWFIFNAKLYRDMRTEEQVETADRVRRWRERQKAPKPDVTDNVTSVTGNAEVEVEVEVDSLSTTREGTGNVTNVTGNAPIIPSRDQPDAATLAIHRFAHRFENPESWASLLLGYLDGLGTEGGKAATREQVALACNEATALTGDMTPRRFRRILAQVMEKPEVRVASTGKMIRAGEIIDLIREYKPPTPPPQPKEEIVEGATGRLERKVNDAPWVPPPPAWRDKLSQLEVRAVNAIGVQQIISTPSDKRGILLSQLAKALVEAGA